jgi:S1-C subfamily serine protease
MRLEIYIMVTALLWGMTGTAAALLKEELNNIRIFRESSPGVVNIASGAADEGTRFWISPQEETGSGVIIDKRGYILTNRQVVHGTKNLEGTLADGSKWAARIMGSDAKSDLALIKIDAPEELLKVLPFGSAQDLRIGEKVLAIGNPFGLGQTMTAGVVSSLDRDFRLFHGAVMKGMIQTDAAINPGNSGGPLLNSKGEIVGINTALFSPTGASIGIGFAIPAETVKDAMPRMMQTWRHYVRGLLPYLAIGSLLLYFINRRAGKTHSL